MGKIVALLFGFLLMWIIPQESKPAMVNAPSQQLAPASQNSIKLTIATAGPLLDPPTDKFEVGEQIPITITLTNTSSQPVYTCVSGDFYQDIPRLTRDGKVVPVTDWQTKELKKAQQDRTCQRENLAEPTLLKPNEPTIVDWLFIVDDSRLPMGGMSWYDQLTPGQYELSIQRRFDCCDGPTVESNKIRFDVVA